MTTTNKPPAIYWIISVLALLWNILGVMAYLGQAYMTDELKAEYSAEQLALIESTPAWVTAAFAFAVFGGFLGCVALLLRKKWAKQLFLISLLGVLAQNAYSFFMTNASEVFGTTQGVVMPLMVIIIAVFLYWYAKQAAAKNWIS